MDLITVLIGAGIIGLVVRTVSIKKLNEFFKEIADSLQLKFIEGSILGAPEIKGKIDGCSIRIKRIAKDKKQFIQVESVRGKDIPPDIGIRNETTFTKMQRMVGIKDIETGDSRFDSEILLESTYSQALLGLLNHDARHRILSLNAVCKSFVVAHSSVTAFKPKSMDLTASDIVYIVKVMVLVTIVLSDKTPLVEKFQRNIEFDPVPEVRINNIRALAAHTTDKAAIDIILKKALNNTSPDVQVEAAKYLGKEGMEFLVEMLVTRGNSLKYRLLMEIVGILTDREYKESIPVFKEMYREQKVELKLNILRAFAKFGNTGLNSFLLAELEKNDPDFLGTLIDALGTCGEVEAVEKLYRIGKDSLNPFTRQKVKESIAKIQARLGNVEKGWLSVTQLQDTEGALSVTDPATEGALSTIQDSDNPKVN